MVAAGVASPAILGQEVIGQVPRGSFLAAVAEMRPQLCQGSDDERARLMPGVLFLRAPAIRPLTRTRGVRHIVTRPMAC
ncbi:hypothetical protein D3C81_1088870 [compost metagenome]